MLRQKKKYLAPEDRSLSPVKRAKGSKLPDSERTLSNWLRKATDQGRQVTDDEIREQARFFGTVGPEIHQKMSSASWLEKFKQKNGIGTKLMRRASETNISDISSLNPDSAGPSASQTPNGVSPTSPGGVLSPSPLSATRSEEDLKAEHLHGYLEFGREHGGYRHSNSQSTTSLSSAFTDNGPSSFSGGPTSPTTPFAFSPDQSGSWLPSQQARLPPPGSNFQRPRSQTFPMLGIEPGFMSAQGNEPLTPKYSLPMTAPSSALDSPIHEMAPPFGMDSALSSPPLHLLHHSSSNGSMGPPPSGPPSGTPITGLQSPPGSSAPGSPTQDDARRALETLLTFITHAPNGLVDQNEYMTVLKMTERLRLQQNHLTLPGGLHRIAEQDCELPGPKMEQSMGASC